VGIGILANPVKAGNDFSLELESLPWDTIFGGETKTAELKIINNTGYLLDGKAIFSATYEDELFQGNLEAIRPSFSINDGKWIDFSEWQDGETMTSEAFIIPGGEISANFKMETHPALIPGQYSFTLKLEGATTETGEPEETYTARTIIGGGGHYVSRLSIYYEKVENVKSTEAIITWKTNKPATSRVIYSSEFESHTLELDNPPNYGYAHSTVEDLVKVTNHSVTIIGLTPGTTYYYRTISCASPPIIGQEHRFTTPGTTTEEEATEEEKEEKEISGGETEEGIGGEEKKEEEEEGGEGEEEEVIPGGEIGETTEEAKESEESKESEETLPGEERIPVSAPQRGLASAVAAVGMIWGEISKSAFLIITVILCLTGLVLIGIREWRLFRKRKKISEQQDGVEK